MEAVVVALIGPLLGGVISVGIWMNKKSSEHISNGFEKLGDNVQSD